MGEKKIRKNRDILWKGVLRCVFDDLLRFVFPDADEIFDMEKPFDFLDKELDVIERALGKNTKIRVADDLVKVYKKDGSEEWILIHVEVQDETKQEDRPFFPERMFQYFYRCYDAHKRPVAAIAIFCGPDGRILDNCFRYDFLGTALTYKYNTLRILDFSDEELVNSSNPFTWVLLIAKQALLRGRKLNERLLEGKLFIFRRLYEKGVLKGENCREYLSF